MATPNHVSEEDAGMLAGACDAGFSEGSSHLSEVILDERKKYLQNVERASHHAHGTHECELAGLRSGEFNDVLTLLQNVRDVQ